MNRIAIEAKKDFLERLAVCSPIKAVSELIWNGLDAGADHISVRFESNTLEGLEKIRVKDTGCGIKHEDVQSLFGNLGESWKNSKSRFKGRALHGKNGEGRFKAFALGTRVEWQTVYDSDNGPMRYKIIGSANSLTDLQFTDPVKANGDPFGTEVIVSGIEKSHGSLLGEKAREELAKYFAAYLSQYPDITIEYDGQRVDPSNLQLGKKEILLEDIPISNGKKVDASVTIVEWSMPSKRVVHLCDADGVSLHETEAGQTIRAPGFEFTVYIKSNHFREMDKEGTLVLDELHPDVVAIVNSAKHLVKKFFRRRLSEKQSQIVERWKKEEIYPFENKEHLTTVEEVERQVFDILAVNIESYLPAFEDADQKSRCFMFRLLAQAVQESPDSVQRIIAEMLNLKKEEQETLADLLEVTSLSNIISSAKIVANRLDFLVALENLIFDKKTKKKLLERDQLHKILENEAWIFHEEFALSGSEKTLEEVLEMHLGEMRAEDISEPVLREDGQQGRVDLMFSRMIQPRHNERDHLVVELKRPSQPINSKILGQVESYAIAVAKDPRFLKENTRWRFVVVANSMDEHAKEKAQQKERPKGLVYDSGTLNIQVWAYEWTEIIATARARLQFINKSLSYEAGRDTARTYLEKAHSKFIPNIDAESAYSGKDENDSSDNDESK
jgi:hypothetical protein